MRIFRSIGLTLAACFSTCASAQSILDRVVEADLSVQCTPGPGNPVAFVSCFEALRLHGVGKDDEALDALSRFSSFEAYTRYKLASSWPKDQFWILVATALPPAVAAALGCYNQLPQILESQFLYSSEAVSRAATDYSKNKFTALYDLLVAVPSAGLPAVSPPPPAPAIPAIPYNTAVNTYRHCFANPDHLFMVVKAQLKPRY